MRTLSTFLLCALALAGANAPAYAATPPASRAPPKASSLAPHHTRRRVYGAPIQQPILHRRHKRAPRGRTHAKAPGPAPKEPAALPK
ncbi:MAG: hypothetical protein ACRETG_03830 [Steroidobacteraceae bacterium]